MQHYKPKFQSRTKTQMIPEIYKHHEQFSTYLTTHEYSKKYP